ncbi:MAG: hypothetical protein JW724_01615 [Candidatus Altiarchaeota archaeon]|nr:hypothetical protein [Candidatus Altiarchaeota archaeon]
MESKTKITAAGLIIVIIAALAFHMLQDADKPRYLTKVAGVEVYSSISLERFMEKNTVALYTTGDKAATTCNFEIRAVSNLDVSGYRIYPERKPLEIVLDRQDAYIRGESDEDLLKACHAFICLREGIECPSNIMDIKNITLKRNEMILVIDNQSYGKAIQGFTEISGALGFLQAQLVDADKNGVVTEEEVNESKIHIFPYIMEGDTCNLQPFQDALQITNITNATTECDFKWGIYITPSRKNAITIDGMKILISGDENHIYAASVIVRDILSPEYIRFLNRLY